MSGGGDIHALCDDALAEILVRLPSESVLRCRAVCKSWRRIATGRSFLAAHAARSPREMITLTQSWTLSAVPLSPGLDAADDGARRRYLCDLSRYHGDGKWAGWSTLVASLDGLLVLQQRPGLYVVCNPTTRQWTNLPVLAPQPCAAAFQCGFYHHRPSGEYRLLCHAEEHREPGSSDWKDYYYTLSAGSTLPRRLARAPADRPYKTDFYELPVAHRGTLYWLCLHPERRRTGKMLAFHTDSETFRLVSRPPTGYAPPVSALLELDGALCAVANRNWMLLDVWVLQDYEAGRWTLRHRVAAPPPKCSDGRGLLATWAISVDGSTILVGDGISGVIGLCDLEEKSMKEVQLHSTPTFVMFSESLVSHDFFQAPRCPELAPLKFPD
ncbi:F-box protein At3g07870 [Setaria italica]|uniref:F-box protein At3g07870 n=1 Tax=Setaria italica TaxID=4555 RepID=UPI0003508F32|nr:F-box protein At3g07870 [Setaria italica]XP_034586505.1 F-box protein At3g07870-like [Setaria viridis]